MTLNEHAAAVHAANAKWWVNLKTGKPLDRNIGELLALVHSELSEAFEGFLSDAMDDHLPNRRMYEVEIADTLIRLLDIAGKEKVDLDGLRARLSNASPMGVPIRDLCEIHLRVSRALEGVRKGNDDKYRNNLAQAIYYIIEMPGIDLWGAYEDKMAYNRVRLDHSLEHRKKEGGKKF